MTNTHPTNKIFKVKNKTKNLLTHKSTIPFLQSNLKAPERQRTGNHFIHLRKVWQRINGQHHSEDLL